MRLNKKTFLVLSSSLGLLLSTNAFSQTQSFRCNFTDGFVTQWESGKPSTKRTTMDEMVFDQIDVKKGTGRVIGNAGAENVQTMSGDNSIHIIERTNSGNINITTIYFYNPKNPNAFPVVHSRQMNLMGGPIPSQFAGLCKRLI